MVGINPAACENYWYKRVLPSRKLSAIWQVINAPRAVQFLLKEGTMSQEVQTFIDETVKEHPVVLFMKGTAQMPQCGFSARAVQILRAVGLKEVVTINVLDDNEVREIGRASCRERR